jgi:hypothetical protein
MKVQAFVVNSDTDAYILRMEYGTIFLRDRTYCYQGCKIMIVLFIISVINNNSLNNSDITCKNLKCKKSIL